MRTFDNIWKIAAGQGNYYKTGCLLNYNNLMRAIDLSKQETLDADPKAIQQISVTGNLEKQATIFFIIEEAKETILIFHNELLKYCEFILL